MNEAEKVDSLLQGIRELVAKYPRLSIPAGAIALLLVGVTMIRTLVDGYNWFTHNWGNTGGGVAIATIVIISVVTNLAVQHWNKAQPVIFPLPKQFLSRHPTVRWEYSSPDAPDAAYKVIVTELDATGKPKQGVPPRELPGPKRVQYRELGTINGPVEIQVVPVINKKKELKASRTVRTEVYQNSLERIKHTGELRVGVHADAGEDIFCCIADDDWCGFDIELSSLFAEYLQQLLGTPAPIRLEPVFYPWPEVISAPNSYEVDMAIASITISTQREAQENIIFSAPYASSGLGVVANMRGFEHLASTPVTLEDMHGKKVAVHKGTTAENFMHKAMEDEKYQDIKFHVAESNHELQALRNYAFDFVIYDHKRCYSLAEPGMFIQKLRHEIDILPDEYGVTFSRANSRLRKEMTEFIKLNHAKLTQLLDTRMRAALANKEEER